MFQSSWIIALIIFVVALGGLFFSEVPISITQDEVFAAIDDAIAETAVQVDETEVQQVVEKSLKKLEDRQKRRLKFLASAYFVIWLIFILYALRLAKNQGELQKRLDRLAKNDE